MIKNIMFYPNGNTGVFDEHGEQIGEFQKSWLRLFAEFLVEQGIEPDGLIVDLPDMRQAKIFKVDDGYNWEILH